MTLTSLRIVPLPLDEANAFVLVHHRHHPPVVGGALDFNRPLPMKPPMDLGPLFHVTGE